MQRPSWALIVGIFMIFFGGCGALNDLKQIKTKDLVKLQSSVLVDVNINNEDDNTLPQKNTELVKQILGDSTLMDKDSLTSADLIKSIKEISHISDKDQSNLILYGYLGLLISLIYLSAGIYLIIRRKHALKFAQALLVISLLFAIIQIIHYRSSDLSNLMKMGLNFTFYLGGFLDLILLIVIFAGDKSYYYEGDTIEDYYD